MAALAEGGLPLLFVDDLPQRASEDAHNCAAIWRLVAQPTVASRPLAEAAQWVQELGLADIHVSTHQPVH